MKNWKTSLGGTLASIGLLAQSVPNHTVQLIGGVAAAVGALLLGLSAKDHNVTGGTTQQ